MVVAGGRGIGVVLLGAVLLEALVVGLVVVVTLAVVFYRQRHTLLAGPRAIIRGMRLRTTLLILITFAGLDSEDSPTQARSQVQTAKAAMGSL